LLPGSNLGTVVRAKADIQAQWRPIILPASYDPDGSALFYTDGVLYVGIKNAGRGPALYIRAQIEPDQVSPENWPLGALAVGDKYELEFRTAKPDSRIQVLFDYRDLAERTYSTSLTIEVVSGDIRFYDAHLFENHNVTTLGDAVYPQPGLRDVSPRVRPGLKARLRMMVTVFAGIFTSMSETWTSPLSGAVGAFLGAIVGGTFSLLGTRYAIKHQMATNARMRLCDELLPKLADAVDSVIDPLVPEDQMAEVGMPELLERVRRASAIAGRFERKAAHKLMVLWRQYEGVSALPLPHIPSPVLASDVLEAHRKFAEEPAQPEQPRPDSHAEDKAKRAAILGQMKKEVRALSDHLGAKLG
jgi:hypothetical protein